MKTDLIIFDLDGTLIDSSADIAIAANHTLKALGLPQISHQAVKDSIGWGVGMLLKKILPEHLHGRLDEARDIFMAHYCNHALDTTRPYEGVEDVLEHFKEKKLAIATNKPFGLTSSILDGLDLRGYFRKIVGGDNVTNKKPSPEALNIILEYLSVPSDSALFVGDSRIDIEAGKMAGIRTVGAVYGFRGRQELQDAGADVLIGSIKDLIAVCNQGEVATNY